METEIKGLNNYHKKKADWCEKCQEYNPTWIDGACTICRKDKPNTTDLLAITYQRLGSLKNHLTFYTVLIAINMLVIFIVLLSGGF